MLKKHVFCHFPSYLTQIEMFIDRAGIKINWDLNTNYGEMLIGDQKQIFLLCGEEGEFGCNGDKLQGGHLSVGWEFAFYAVVYKNGGGGGSNNVLACYQHPGET